jgi:hypothetical protein
MSQYCKLAFVLAAFMYIGCTKNNNQNDQPDPNQPVYEKPSGMKLSFKRINEKILSTYDFTVSKNTSTFIVHRIDSQYQYFNDQLINGPYTYSTEFKYMFDETGKKLQKVTGKRVWHEAICCYPYNVFFQIDETYGAGRDYPYQQDFTYFRDSNMTDMSSKESFYSYSATFTGINGPGLIYVKGNSDYYTVAKPTSDSIAVINELYFGHQSASDTRWYMWLQSNNYTFTAYTETNFHLTSENFVDDAVATNYTFKSEWTNANPAELITKKIPVAQRRRHLNVNKELADLLSGFSYPDNQTLAPLLNLYNDFFIAHMYDDISYLFDDLLLTTNNSVDSVFYSKNDKLQLVYVYKTQSTITKDEKNRISLVELRDNENYCYVTINFYYEK